MKNWVTFDNKVKKIEELDQQHLSNIYWFFKIFWGIEKSWVFEELKNKYNGQLLLYRPHLSYKEEIEGLIRKEMIFLDKDKSFNFTNYYYIKIDNKIIGEIITIEKLFE